MLDSFDLEAGEAARSLQDMLGGTHAGPAGRLADATAGLDFDAAAAALAELRAALENAPKEGVEP